MVIFFEELSSGCGLFGLKNRSEEYAAESVISPIPEEVLIDGTISENAPFKISRSV